MEFVERVKKVVQAYKDGSDVDLIDNLLPIIAEAVSKQTAATLRLPHMELRDLEDLLTVVKELKDDYESQPEKTGQMMIRIDELRQLEFKLSEIVFTHRSK